MTRERVFDYWLNELLSHFYETRCDDAIRSKLNNINKIFLLLGAHITLTRASNSPPTLRNAMYCFTPSMRFWNSTRATFMFDIIEPIRRDGYWCIVVRDVKVS